MNRLHVLWMLTLAISAAPAVAQEPPAQPGSEAVATVNGETISRAQFDAVWDGLAEPVRARYETEGGGRAGYLETFIQRRVLLQDAARRGFDRWPEVAGKEEAEKEGAVFDLYVREVVAPTVVTDEAMRRMYDENLARFQAPERVKLRIIGVSTRRRMPVDARKILQDVSVQLFSTRKEFAGDPNGLTAAFAAAARKVSEHPSAAAGGDLGWVDPEKLEPVLAEAARAVSERMVSGMLQVPDGYALILVERRVAARTIEYAEARDAIRERLMAQSGPAIVAAAAEHARALRSAAEVTLFLENLE